MVTKRKRTPKLSDEWLHDVWTLCQLDRGSGELADFDELISSAVARCLKDKSRLHVAGDLSTLFGKEISAHMLNAYASEARTEHRIPASLFLAMIGLTRRFDILDAVVRKIGGKALNESAAKEFRIGKHYVHHLNAVRVLSEDVANLFRGHEQEAEGE